MFIRKAIILLFLLPLISSAGVKEAVRSFITKLNTNKIVLYENVDPVNGNYFTFSVNGKKKESLLTPSSIMSLKLSDRRQLLYLIAKSIGLEDIDARTKFRKHFKELFLDGKKNFFSETERDRVIRPSDFNISNVATIFFKGLEEARKLSQNNLQCGGGNKALNFIKEKVINPVKNKIKKTFHQCMRQKALKMEIKRLETLLKIKIVLSNVYEFNAYADLFEGSSDLEDSFSEEEKAKAIEIDKRKTTEMSDKERMLIADLKKAEKCLHESKRWGSAAAEAIIAGKSKKASTMLQQQKNNLSSARDGIKIKVLRATTKLEKEKFNKDLMKIDKKVALIDQQLTKLDKNEKIDTDNLTVLTKEEELTLSLKSAALTAGIKGLDPTYVVSAAIVSDEGVSTSSKEEVILSKDIKNYTKDLNLKSDQDVYNQVRKDLLIVAKKKNKKITDEQADKISSYIVDNNREFVDYDLILEKVDKDYIPSEFEYIGGKRYASVDLMPGGKYHYIAQENPSYLSKTRSRFASNYEDNREDFDREVIESVGSGYYAESRPEEDIPMPRANIVSNKFTSNKKVSKTISGKISEPYGSVKSSIAKPLNIDNNFYNSDQSISKNINHREDASIEPLFDSVNKAKQTNESNMKNLSNKLDKLKNASVSTGKSSRSLAAASTGQVSSAGYSYGGGGNVAAMAAPSADSSQGYSSGYETSYSSNNESIIKVKPPSIDKGISSEKKVGRKLASIGSFKENNENNDFVDDSNVLTLEKSNGREFEENISNSSKDNTGIKDEGKVILSGVNLKEPKLKKVDKVVDIENPRKRGELTEQEIVNVIESNNWPRKVYNLCGKTRWCKVNYLNNNGELFGQVGFRFVVDNDDQAVGIRLDDYEKASDMLLAFPLSKTSILFRNMNIQFGDKRSPVQDI